MKRTVWGPAMAVAMALTAPACVLAHEVTCDESDGDLCYYWSRAMGETVLADDPEMVGTVTVDLVIDPTGHVSGCAVRQSSGSEVVDRSTCAQLRAYAHYRPALDDAGQPTTGADSVTIRWATRPSVLPPAADPMPDGEPAEESQRPWS